MAFMIMLYIGIGLLLVLGVGLFIFSRKKSNDKTKAASIIRGTAFASILLFIGLTVGAVILTVNNSYAQNKPVAKAVTTKKPVAKAAPTKKEAVKAAPKKKEVEKTTSHETVIEAKKPVDPMTAGMGYLAAAIAVSIGSIGAGIAVGMSAAAAVGAISENPKVFGNSIVFVGLAEGIAIYGLIIAIMILSKL